MTKLKIITVRIILIVKESNIAWSVVTALAIVPPSLPMTARQVLLQLHS